MKNTPVPTVKVNLKKLQIVFGVAYRGECEVPENVAHVLKKRGMLIEPAREVSQDQAPKAETAKSSKKAE